MSNKSFTMAMPEELYKELEELADQYTKQQGSPTVNSLNIQEMLRLLTKTYLRKVRGARKVEELRVNAFSNIQFIVGECPSCHLAVDIRDFPVLMKQGDEFVCRVCGTTGRGEVT